MLLHSVDRSSSFEIARGEAPGPASVRVRAVSRGFSGENPAVYLLGLREFIDDLHHALTTQAGGAKLSGTEAFWLALVPAGRAGALALQAQVGRDYFIEGPGGDRLAPHRVQVAFLVPPERAARLEREFQALYAELAAITT